MENLTLQQLLDIENQTPILSLRDFLDYQRLERAISSFLYCLTCGNYLWNPFERVYTTYRVHGFIYQVIDELYQKVLEDLIDVIVDTKIETDPLSLSVLMSDHLIPFGVLSYSKRFHSTSSSKLFACSNVDIFYHLDEKKNYGKVVFCGFGCCRHVASLVGDLFEKMGIVVDRVPCFSLKQEEIPSALLEQNVNHLILGYLWNHQYYLVDIMNQHYALSAEEEYIETRDDDKLVLDYSSPLWFQDFFHHTFDMDINSFSMEEVLECKRKVVECLNHGALEKFQQFKKDHFDIYEKLAYLVPIEMNRSTWKENQKRKVMGIPCL